MSLDPHRRFLLTWIAGQGLSDHLLEPIDRLKFGEEAVAFLLSSGYDVVQLARRSSAMFSAKAMPRSTTIVEPSGRPTRFSSKSSIVASVCRS